MLLTLLYHYSFQNIYGNKPENLEKNFLYLKKNYPIKFPLESLERGRINVCLSFDDATFDFYHFVYPLLKKYDLKALLSVPTGYILDSTDLPADDRLRLLKEFSFDLNVKREAFCTYQELMEMVESGHIEIASHGMRHENLKDPSANLQMELIESKRVLKSKLGREINIFSFPYGGYSKESLEVAKKEYQIVMRIGNGLNFSSKTFLQYRVNADGVEDLRLLFKPHNLLALGLKRIFHFKTLFPCT